MGISHTYVNNKQHEKAIKYLQKTIELDRDDPDGFYKLAIVYKEKSEFFKALEQISKSIDKTEESKLNNENYYILSMDDNVTRLSIEDLLILRAEIMYNISGENKMSCDDLNRALEESNDDKNKEKSESIQKRIAQICN